MNEQSYFANISDDFSRQVEQQLMLILKSVHFRSARQMKEFLKYVVRKTLSEPNKPLKQYTIAVEGLNLPKNFDSDENPQIRIIAGRVRDRLKKYYQEQGVNDPLIISIPIGSYTPEFSKKEQTAGTKPAKDGVSQGPKLAMVCFTDKTQSKSSNRLLLQVTDTLAKEFSHFLFSRLVVSIPHADKSKSNRVEKEMKTLHNADFTLVLYIHQLPQKKFELLYRLLDTESEEVLWSESYAIDNNVPISAQHEVLGRIIATIADIQQGIMHIHWSRKLLEKKQDVPEEYQTLVYYRHYADNLGRGAFAKGVNFCAQALDRNPNDVVANVVYADYCRREYVYNYGIIKSPLTAGRHAAEIAIVLRPDSHEAHFAMGQILFCSNEWESSANEFNLARSMCKYHAVVEYGTGFHLYLMGQRKKGLSLAKKAMSLSSSYPAWFHLLAFLDAYRNNRFEEALVEARRIVTKNLLHGPLARCVAFSQLGDKQKAQNELHEVLKRYPDFMQDGQRMLFRFLGNEELADKIWSGVIKASE